MVLVSFLVSLNYSTHILEEERQTWKVGKVMKMDLDEGLCATSLKKL